MRCAWLVGLTSVWFRNLLLGAPGPRRKERRGPTPKLSRLEEFWRTQGQRLDHSHSSAAEFDPP